MRLLIVEDEHDLAEMLAIGLRHEGHVVEVEFDGAQALAWLRDNDADVVVLDRDLPMVHGDAVCRTLVAEGHPARILMLTASGTLGDLVDGFAIGADDYLPKPFAYLELLARIQALGRRTGRDGARRAGASVLERAGIRLDLRRQIAEKDGIPLNLTPKELGVLRVLLEADGAYRTATNLLDAVWDDPFARSTDVVKVVIHALRGKLGDRRIVETGPGFGYRIP
ncbi:MAG: response regulator transcription factor [Thermomicrobiales bacterium]